MSEFINTLDVLDDDIVIDSIISKTITEFSDNIITSIGAYAFINCSSLTKVELPNVTDISGPYVFNGCGSLQTIDLSKAIGTIPVRFFEQCSSLTSINIPEATGVDVNTFAGCSSLSSVNLPKITFVAGNGFASCANLGKLTFPKLTVIKYGAFSNCRNLTALILGSNTLCSLENINAFSYSSIESGTGYIYVPKTLLNNYKTATNWSVYANNIRAIEDYPQITGGI